MNTRQLLSVCLCLAGVATALAADEGAGKISTGVYRLPFADGTVVKVFDDFSTHRPNPALDLFAIEGHKPYRAAAC